jgi:hypothetical protein
MSSYTLSKFRKASGTKPNPKKDRDARRKRAAYPEYPNDYKRENLYDQLGKITGQIFCGRRSDGARVSQG